MKCSSLRITAFEEVSDFGGLRRTAPASHFGRALFFCFSLACARAHLSQVAGKGLSAPGLMLKEWVAEGRDLSGRSAPGTRTAGKQQMHTAGQWEQNQPG